MNKVEEYNENPHGVGTGKVFLGKGILDVTKATYQDRNVNFRKSVKELMFGLLSHPDYKTLNLQAKTYNIELRLSIVPQQLVVVPEKKIQVVQ